VELFALRTRRPTVQTRRPERGYKKVEPALIIKSLVIAMTVAQNWVEICNQFRLEQGRMTIPVWMLAADGLASWNHAFTRMFTLLARHALEKKVTSGIC
jgi:hypothetical protein